MREFVVGDEDLTTLFEGVGPHLDQRQRRVLAGSMARALGRDRGGGRGDGDVAFDGADGGGTVR